jgi:hypothetical protein
MTTLADALDVLDQYDGDSTIYVAEPWAAQSEARVALEDSDQAVGALQSGLRYFLEVWLAREALEVWTAWRGGQKPSPAERCEAVIYYATNDAYQPLN